MLSMLRGVFTLKTLVPCSMKGPSTLLKGVTVDARGLFVIGE